jgi:shikimate dehydrogenase
LRPDLGDGDRGFRGGSSRDLISMKKKFAVLGRSLGHSLSPIMHQIAFEKHNIDAEYLAIEYEPDDIFSVMERIKNDKFSGFNITIPYKTEIFNFLDHVDSAADKIGAVNTVKIENDVWSGFNTDVSGFLQPLKRVDNKFGKCLILGNGGAARAVVFALINHIETNQITICARNKQKSDRIIRDLGSNIIQHEPIERAEDLICDADLIVNTTPLGMSPDLESCPLEMSNSLKKNAVVYDLIYNPLFTRLLRQAKEKNPQITVINGLEMLVGQAAEAFRIWTGLDFPSQEVLEALEKRLKG